VRISGRCIYEGTRTLRFRLTERGVLEYPGVHLRRTWLGPPPLERLLAARNSPNPDRHEERYAVPSQGS
jgi:hypothetical protein